MTQFSNDNNNQQISWLARRHIDNSQERSDFNLNQTEEEKPLAQSWIR